MVRTITLRKVLLIGLLTLLTIAQVGTASAGTNVWSSNGPEAGTIQALAIDPVTSTTLYAATFGGGVFKSTNGGGAWSAVNTSGLRDSKASWCFRTNSVRLRHPPKSRQSSAARYSQVEQ